MFRKIEDFEKAYGSMAEEGAQILGQLTDASLNSAVAEGHRTIGAVAWHIVQSVAGMANEVNLGLDTGVLEEPIPGSAEHIAESYRKLTAALLDAVKAQWTDDTLLQEDQMYGQTWQRGFTLMALYNHEIHHFGQLTVLMRHAGLPVHGRFGPSKEEWAQYGMEQPPGA